LRLSILPDKVDGLSRSDSLLSSMARSFGIRSSARCLTLIGSARRRIPRRLQQPGQTISSRCSHNVRTHLPRVGHPHHDHEPPLGIFLSGRWRSARRGRAERTREVWLKTVETGQQYEQTWRLHMRLYISSTGRIFSRYGVEVVIGVRTGYARDLSASERGNTICK
jgi:hypothetical protein